jgi:thiol:disulfide interchange protein DsbD
MYSPKLDSVHGSFMFGVMVAVLSTPCTAPFMGAAAAWAALQPPVITLSAFAAIGVGMAAPYQLLSIFPQWAHKMPRTGPASEVIKQVMGLLMLAAATYFVGVGLSGLLVQPPNPPSKAYWWVVALFGVMAGAWMAWRTVRLTRSPWRLGIFGGLGLAIAVLSGSIGVRLTDKGPIDWVYYTPERFAQAKADGQVVVMEFTAEWCLNCKALEETVLRSPRVVQLFEQDGVVPIKVDITNYPAGNRMLDAVDRLTVPLLVIFRPDGTEVFKGDFYSVQQVLDAVNDARPVAMASNP